MVITYCGNGFEALYLSCYSVFIAFKPFFMKKLTRQPALFFCMTALLFSMACRKQISLDTDNNGLTNKVNAWLDAQKVTTSQDQNSRIDMLKNELDFSRLRIEAPWPEKDFIIIPLKSGFKSLNNKGKNAVTVLLLKAVKQADIIEGNIVQYVPANGQVRPNIPPNTFFNIYNNVSSSELDGQFTFLSIRDKLLFKVEYKNGILFSSGITRPGTSSTVVNSPPQDPISPPPPACIDWYLVTTYYYPDGSTSQTEEYLYTTCEVSGGGGEGHDEEVFPVIAQASWTVEAAGSWSVVSTESFNGIKKASEERGGHFTGMTHNSSTMNAVGITGGKMKWVETGVITNPHGYTATCIISGWISFESLPHNSWAYYVPNRPKTFFFNLLDWH